MRCALIAFALAASLAGCARPSAPEEVGVCWQAGSDPGKFTALARHVGNLETCAVLLEALHLKGAAEVDGAYQGYFVFVDAKAITSGRSEAGLHYPVFQPAQRAEVDRDLAKLLKEGGGQLPDAGQISLERH